MQSFLHIKIIFEVQVIQYQTQSPNQVKDTNSTLYIKVIAFILWANMLDGHHPSKLVHDDVLEERERGVTLMLS